MNSDLHSRIDHLVTQMESALSHAPKEFEDQAEEWRTAVASIFVELGDSQAERAVKKAHLIDATGVGFGNSFIDSVCWNTDVVRDLLRRLKAVNPST